jgi:hypothetical protein
VRRKIHDIPNNIKLSRGARMLLSVLFLVFTSSPTHALGPNDISRLLPLPRNEAERELMLSPDSQGKGGSLLPLSIFQALPQIVSDRDQEFLYQTALRVVGIRFDPCFQEKEEPCRRQIRMIWQPVVNESGWTTLDASIHTFYEFSPLVWARIFSELTLLPSEGAAHLQVSPQISRESLAGPTWKKLARLVLQFAGEESLIRATSFSVNPLGNRWFFAGLDIQGTNFKPIKIARLEGAAQAYATQLGTVGQVEFRAAMNPAPASDLEFLALLKDSWRARENLTLPQLVEATRSALAIENPRLTNPGNVDCASCHVAHVVPTWALRNLQLDWGKTFAREMFRAGPNGVPPLSEGDANVLRAFGYFRDKAVVSRRVDNETSLILESFRKP